MPFCPKCRTEYESKHNTCTDCGSILVDEILPLEKNDFNEVSFLTSVGDEIQADMIEAELKSSDIKVLKKYKEAGAYLEIYMGMTSFGIDLYVPSKQLNAAKEKLKDLKIQEITEEEDDELFEENKNYKKKRVFRAWIILLFFVPGIIFILYSLFMFIFTNR